MPYISSAKLQKQSHIALLECSKCKIQYIRKSETQFNIRLNKHKDDVTRKDSIPASNHIEIEGHDFKRYVKLITIGQLNQKNLDKSTLRKRLKARENLWNLTLETLHPRDLNGELIKI